MSDDAPNNEKEALQQELRDLGVSVNDAWELPALKRKLTMAKSQEPATTAPSGETVVVEKPKAKPGMVEMVLLKNYQPGGEYEIVGYHRKERLVKNAAGEMIVAEPSAFIEGEMHPSPFPGVGYDGKVWAGTKIRLPREEAMRCYEKKIAERGFD